MGKRMVFRRPTQVGFMVTYPSRENTSHAFLVDIHTQRTSKRNKKMELHLLIDVNVISLFIFSYGQYLNSVHRP